VVKSFMQSPIGWQKELLSTARGNAETMHENQRDHGLNVLYAEKAFKGTGQNRKYALKSAEVLKLVS
jgi:hypothetical protein